MTSFSSSLLRRFSRLYIPVAMLCASIMLATRASGTGVGFEAGLVFAFALVLHVLVFGVDGARGALPPPIANVLLVIGVMVSGVGIGLPNMEHAASFVEAGIFLATAAGSWLTFVAIAGRAPSIGGDTQ